MKSSLPSMALAHKTSENCDHTHLQFLQFVSETTTTTGVCARAPLFCVSPFHGLQRAAQFRSCTAKKAARLRSWWRHEQQSIAAALAAAQHHSVEKSAGPVSHNVLRNQNTAREGTEFYAMSEDSDVVGGGRSPSLVEVRQRDRVPRHSVVQIIENFVPVPILDGPVPQSSIGGVQDQILQRTAELVTERRSCW